MSTETDTPIALTPVLGAYYRHRDGGVYVAKYLATLTSDSSQVVVYEHQWPFEEHVWARPVDEFMDGRFTRMTREEVKELLDIAWHEDARKQAQQDIAERRAARKAAEAAEVTSTPEASETPAEPQA